MSNKLSLLVNFVAIDKLSDSLRGFVGLGRKGSASLNALRGEGRKLEAQLKKVRAELSGSTGNVTALMDRERDLERQIAETNQQLERRKRLNVIEADHAAMMRRGDQLRQRGQENIAQGAALSAPLIAATAAAAQFSSGMVDIQQKAALSDAATDRLGGRIVLMAKAAKQMPEDIRSGLDLLLAKGMGLDAATAAIGPAGRLATAYKVELPDAAAAAFASVSNLRVASAQTARVFDAMAAAGNEGGFEVRDMARHFPALTAQMQALGAKGLPAVADLSAALQVAMHTAGTADEAGNNIQNLLAKINAPGTIAAFKKNFGIDLPAAMKKLEDQGYTSMEAIAMLTKQATGGDMKKLGFAFEDQQARMGILALIQNMEEYRRIRAAAMNSGGTVDKAFDQRVARDAMVQWTAFKSSVSQVAITLGSTLLPVANEVLGMISRLAAGVAAWAQKNPEAAATVTKLVAGLAVFKIGLGVAQLLLGSVIGPLSTAIRMFRLFGGAARIFQLVAAGARMLLPLLAGVSLPVLAIGAAIGVLAYLVYTHWDSIKAAFNTGVAWIRGKLGALPNWMQNIGKMMMAGLLTFLTPGALVNRLLGIAKAGVTAFKSYFGIKSPSRLFMEMGGHMTSGLGIGIDRGGRRPLTAMGQLATGVSAAGALALSPMAAAAGGPGRAGNAPGPAAAAPAPVTINVYQQPGEDGEALARRIAAMLARRPPAPTPGSYEDFG